MPLRHFRFHIDIVISLILWLPHRILLFIRWYIVTAFFSILRSHDTHWLFTLIFVAFFHYYDLILRFDYWYYTLLLIIISSLLRWLSLAAHFAPLIRQAFHFAAFAIGHWPLIYYIIVYTLISHAITHTDIDIFISDITHASFFTLHFHYTYFAITLSYTRIYFRRHW